MALGLALCQVTALEMRTLVPGDPNRSWSRRVRRCAVPRAGKGGGTAYADGGVRAATGQAPALDVAGAALAGAELVGALALVGAERTAPVAVFALALPVVVAHRPVGHVLAVRATVGHQLVPGPAAGQGAVRADGGVRAAAGQAPALGVAGAALARAELVDALA